MATTYLNMKGFVKWAKVQEAVGNYEGTGEETTVDFYPDAESWGSFDESGLQLKKYKDEDEDASYIKLRRPMMKTFGEEIIDLGLPKIVDDKGKDIPRDTLIGNGSVVTVRVKVYDTQKGKGHEFEGMKVHDLVAYEKPETIGVDSPW